jgi:hypothetical protein
VIDPPSRTFSWTAPDGDGMTGIDLPFDPRAVFGKIRAPVVVTLGSYSYRSTIFAMNGRIWVPLRRSNREAAGIGPGAVVAVTMTLDTAPREVELPDDLAAALDAAGARTGWDALSYTAKRERVEAITDAKRAETRANRIAAAVTMAQRRLPDHAAS